MGASGRPTAWALRGKVPTWQPVLLAVAAVLFPVAHVGNISWLAITDAVLVVVALGYLYSVRDDLERSDPVEVRTVPVG